MHLVLPNQNFRHEGKVYGPGEIVETLGKRAKVLEADGVVAPLSAKSKGKAAAEESRKLYYARCREILLAEDNNLAPDRISKMTDEQLATRFGVPALSDVVPDEPEPAKK